MNVVGIMSGTSLDGVDYVLCKISAQKVIYIDRAYKRFSKAFKERLGSLAEGQMSFRDAQKLHFDLGEFYYKSLQKIVKEKSWSLDLIGLHGQTVFHFPPKGTCQIGEASYLKKFGVPVVSDFRSKLLVYKTQGAPLAPVFHEELLKKYKSWAFLNLGGMSNLTLKNEASPLVASDFGPANIFLDKAAKELFGRSFDPNGSYSLKGIADYKIVLDYIQSHPYFKKRHPKSCGREEFSEKEYVKLKKKMKKLNSYDVMASLCEISLFPILQQLKSKPVKTLVVSGGGAKNQYFIKRLKEELKTEVLTSEDLGWPVEAIEGGAFALLAYRKFKNKESDFSYLGLKEPLSPLGRMD